MLEVGEEGIAAMILNLEEYTVGAVVLGEDVTIQEGDIIWFHRISDGNPNVLHRVIQKKEGWVVTRGDNTVINDGPTAYKNIKGYCGMIIY